MADSKAQRSMTLFCKCINTEGLTSWMGMPPCPNSKVAASTYLHRHIQMPSIYELNRFHRDWTWNSKHMVTVLCEKLFDSIDCRWFTCNQNHMVCDINFDHWSKRHLIPPQGPPVSTILVICLWDSAMRCIAMRADDSSGFEFVFSRTAQFSWAQREFTTEFPWSLKIEITSSLNK